MSYDNQGGEFDLVDTARQGVGGGGENKTPVLTEPKESNIIKYVRPCVAEALMVMIFVFIGTITVQNTRVSEDNFNIVAIATAHGLTITLLVLAFGSISGAHINPAVTLAVTLGGGLKPVMAVPYVISQLIGSVIGAGLVRAVLDAGAYASIGGGGQTPAAGVNAGEAMVCEVVATLVLTLTVLITAVDTDGKNPAAPFAIGFAVIADILAVGNLSGASMNPARSFGPTLMVYLTEDVDRWEDHWIYWVGPILGAILAAGLYRLLFARPDKRFILKPKY